MSTVSPPPLPTINCTRCGAVMPADRKVCPNCGLFVHAPRLAQLSSEALQLEATDPWAASAVWQQLLQLLPEHSPQWQSIQQRIEQLSTGVAPAPPTAPRRAARSPDTFTKAIAKTVGSMLLSIVVYAYLFHDLAFSVAFVVLMLVHELGHVAANKYYRLSASPPIFIPFLGAVINLKTPPPNAKVEAIVGIGGPIAGTFGALVCYLFYLHTHSELLLYASHFGFLLNLFNLLPVPPLDGGRITAAVSPWIWVLGLAGLVWMFVTDYRKGQTDYILLLVLFYAFPRIQATLRARGQLGDYYKISNLASRSIAGVYILLGAVLLYFYYITKIQTGSTAW